VTDGFVGNLGDAGAGTTTLAAGIGPTGDTVGFVTSGDVRTANAVSSTRGTAIGTIQNFTAAVDLFVNFVTTGGNLSDVTGLANGVVVVVEFSA
jgi:hypothetical protein